MKRIVVILPVLAGVLLWAFFAPAQQPPMRSRSGTYEAIELQEVVWELGQPSGGKIAVTWKTEISNTDAKDHTIDLQVNFLDAQGAEIFHDWVMRTKVPAKGTVTVSHTATVDAAKAQNVKSTQSLIRARR